MDVLGESMLNVDLLIQRDDEKMGRESTWACAWSIYPDL